MGLKSQHLDLREHFGTEILIPVAVGGEWKKKDKRAYSLLLFKEEKYEEIKQSQENI